MDRLRRVIKYAYGTRHDELKLEWAEFIRDSDWAWNKTTYKSANYVWRFAPGAEQHELRAVAAWWPVAEENIADIGTRPLSKETFLKLRFMLAIGLFRGVTAADTCSVADMGYSSDTVYVLCLVIVVLGAVICFLVGYIYRGDKTKPDDFVQRVGVGVQSQTTYSRWKLQPRFEVLADKMR